MPPTQPTSGDAARLDGLRRRMYAPDATEADRERYRQALAAAPSGSGSASGSGSGSGSAERSDPPVRGAAAVRIGSAPAGAVEAVPRVRQEEAGSARTAPRRVRPRTLAIAAVLLAAVTTAVLTQTLPRPPHAVVTTVLPVSAEARAAFVRALDRTGSAALATYFYDHPDLRPAAVLTPRRADTEEHAGTGTGTVAVAPSAEADHGGRLTVVLVLARAGTVTWRAARVGDGGNGGSEQQVASRRGAPAAGSPMTSTVRYTGAAPTRLRVEAPAGVRWDVLTVFTD